MPKIETIILRCVKPDAQQRFYTEVLGMRDLGHGTVGYGQEEARLQFVQTDKPYAPNPNDHFWKLALAVPDIELAYAQLRANKFDVSQPHQFQDIGYLAHFRDPEGFLVELIDHSFKGERPDTENVSPHLFGGGAHLNLLTLRTVDMEQTHRKCLDWGMKLLSIQPVKGRGFTLYFYAFTDDGPPSADPEALENRPWLYRRPYTVLEMQHLHEADTIEPSGIAHAGYAGFTISSAKADSAGFTLRADP